MLTKRELMEQLRKIGKEAQLDFMCFTKLPAIGEGEEIFYLNDDVIASINTDMAYSMEYNLAGGVFESHGVASDVRKVIMQVLNDYAATPIGKR